MDVARAGQYAGERGPCQGTCDQPTAREQSLFQGMDYAARFESCDWELPVREGHVFEILLPEVQMTRTWGRMLAAKNSRGDCRPQVYRRHSYHADRFALARHRSPRGQRSSTVSWAIAVASQATGQVEQLIQQPDGTKIYLGSDVAPFAAGRLPSRLRV